MRTPNISHFTKIFQVATRRTGSEWVFDQLHVGEGDHLLESVWISSDQENVLIWGRTYYQEAFDLWGEHGSMTEELSEPTIDFYLNKINRSLSQGKCPSVDNWDKIKQPPPDEHSTSPHSSRVWGFVKHAQTNQVNHRRLMSSWS